MFWPKKQKTLFVTINLDTGHSFLSFRNYSNEFSISFTHVAKDIGFCKNYIPIALVREKEISVPDY